MAVLRGGLSNARRQTHGRPRYRTSMDATVLVDAVGVDSRARSGAFRQMGGLRRQSEEAQADQARAGRVPQAATRNKGGVAGWPSRKDPGGCPSARPWGCPHARMRCHEGGQLEPPVCERHGPGETPEEARSRGPRMLDLPRIRSTRRNRLLPPRKAPQEFRGRRFDPRIERRGPHLLRQRRRSPSRVQHLARR